MKSKYSIYVASLVLASMFTCCQDESPISWDGVKGSPSGVEAITSTPLPGQIGLSWKVPSDSSFYLLKVSYFDHLTSKMKSRVTSIYKDTLLITDTRERFGDYNFTFQTFSADQTSGESVTVSARSGAAPSTTTYTSTKIQLSADQLSTNAQEKTEGDISNLLDGSMSTFFHTDWHNEVAPPHWLDVRLESEITNFKIWFQNRNGSQSCASEVEIYTSNNGNDWTLLTTIISGLPTGSAADYTSEVYSSPKPFTHLRWSVRKTAGNTNYWNMSQFAIYNVDINIVDPEKDEN